MARRLRRGALWLAAAVALVIWADRAFFHAGEPASADGPLEAEAPDTSPALACEKRLAQRGAKGPSRPRGPRIGTWNLRWFPRGTARGNDPERRTDVAWLACAIAELDVDVLAVQEVLDDPEARSAALALTARLDRLTGGRFKLGLDECKGSGRQHVGFLWNSKVVDIEQIEPLAALNPGKSACDLSLRPGLLAYARFDSGPDLHLISVHFDSGQHPRDYANRRTSLERLSRVRQRMGERNDDADLLVLGDFNAMGCEQCSPRLSDRDELQTLDAELTQAGLARALHAGAACSHYYGGRPGLLDVIAHDATLAEAPARFFAEPLGACGELACKRVTRAQRPLALDKLSDHCPVVVELLAQDLDR